MPRNKIPNFEVCVDSAQGIEACVGLVDRIELCSALDIGGLTPSAGLMECAKASGLETHVLIRPAGGDFFMTRSDLDVALADIEQVKKIGLDGVVIGAAIDGHLDTEVLREMAAASAGLKLTLHRAFDVVENQAKALEDAITHGFQRVLTSGGASSAPLALKRLAELVEQSNARIEIMAGGGITLENVDELLSQTGVHAIHSSCSSERTLADPLAQKGFGEVARLTDIEKVREMRDRILSMFPS
ncbi:copper homeostasis protein [Cognatiyoonia sediminum]|uniref:PF03932 family protein CutC n=1 Tax=Cognatiyoonia sediminum TaxID=1508389 RepID=A0A1M5T599_9RHOB|nr:copper homeostasis protein CutC [Cognatiyoonia sediminum]SHH45919.1 copper homeostasis protein [Cognatiyoonia sediminum]